MWHPRLQGVDRRSPFGQFGQRLGPPFQARFSGPAKQKGGELDDLRLRHAVSRRGQGQGVTCGVIDLESHSRALLEQHGPLFRERGLAGENLQVDAEGLAELFSGAAASVIVAAALDARNGSLVEFGGLAQLLLGPTPSAA